MFRVGQKVVCVNAQGARLLEVKKIYTISHMIPEYPEMVGIDCGVGAFGNSGYYASRFRPLVARKTDISIFTKMLTPTGKENVKCPTVNSMA